MHDDGRRKTAGWSLALWVALAGVGLPAGAWGQVLDFELGESPEALPAAPLAKETPPLPEVPDSAERKVSIDGLHFGATVSGAWLLSLRFGWPIEVGAVMNWRRAGFDLRANAVLVVMPLLDKGIEGVPLCAGLGGDFQFNGGSRFGFGLGLTAALGGDLLGRMANGVVPLVSARVAPLNVWLGANRNVEVSAFVSATVLPWFMLGFGLRLTWVFPAGG